MDWVQNKSTGKKNQQPSHAKGKGESTTSASRWLEDLCHENIALLQSSLPLKKEGKAGRRKASVDRPLVESLEWGVTALSSERNADLEYLHGLITAIGRVESTSTGSKLPSEKKVSPEKIAKWIGKQLPLRSEEPVIALMAAGWIHGLPSLGRHLEPTLWLETLQTILSQVDRSWATEEPESMLAWLIWSCEVPLALASHLAHLGSNDRIVSDTLDRLALVLELCKDKKSPWIRRGGSHLRALLACVLRCRWTADLLGARRWYSSQRKALVELACTAIALSDHHGKPLLVDEELGETDAGLWGALLEATEHSSKFADMLSSLPKRIRPNKIKKPSVSTRHLPWVSLMKGPNSLSCAANGKATDVVSRSISLAIRCGWTFWIIVANDCSADGGRSR